MLNPAYLSEISAELDKMVAAKEKFGIAKLDKGIYAKISIEQFIPDRKIVITLDGSIVENFLEAKGYEKVKPTIICCERCGYATCKCIKGVL
jgi:hypothetical protein